MAKRGGCFENQYDDYSKEAAENILNNSRDGISDKFSLKLHNLKSTKLQLLLTEMQSQVCEDATVYTGSAGLAMYYWLCASKKDDTELYLKALNHLELGKRKQRISFLCGEAGPLALATVISYKLGSRRPDHCPEYKCCAQRLMSLINLLNESPDEILYGKSGYLYALLFVNKYIPGKDVIPAMHIERVINAILKSGKQLAVKANSDSPLLYEWHDKIYFGAAHGMAGILYMLLMSRAYISITEIRDFIQPALDCLLSHQFQSGNFPSSLGSSSGDSLVQWCHGAPGFVPLCLAAFQTFEEEKYLRLALHCGDVIWSRGLCAKGYSLCHGVSGNAYAFLQLYQATRKAIHLYRACCFMEWCAVERPGTELHRPKRPASLFEGVIGRLYLAEDLANPLQAKFPGMCL